MTGLEWLIVQVVISTAEKPRAKSFVSACQATLQKRNHWLVVLILSLT
jgi:hypothetical protein